MLKLDITPSNAMQLSTTCRPRLGTSRLACATRRFSAAEVPLRLQQQNPPRERHSLSPTAKHVRPGWRLVVAAGEEPGQQQEAVPDKAAAPPSSPPSTVGTAGGAARGSGNGNGNGSGESSGGGPRGTLEELQFRVDDEVGVKMPKDVIDKLKTSVFGFDTFWVTSVDNYGHDGVVFKGNVRGRDPAVSYQKMRDRLQAAFSGAYQLFLLEDKDEKPTVVVLPQIWLASLFALATTVTSFNAAGAPLLEFFIAPFSTAITQQDFVDALPGVLAFFFALGSHDFGHYQAARRHGLELYLPFYLPAGFGLLGSFGSITRVRNFVPSREALLDLAVSGPLLGSAVSGAMLLLGLVLTRAAAGIGTVGVDTAALADSTLVALLAGLFVGPEGLAQPVTEVNFLVLAGWAGLIANALNLIPAGELDGAKMVLGCWGRRTASAVSVFTTGALGFSAITGNALSFYWVLLLLFLQRGPISPCCEELSVPKNEFNRKAALALLGFSLLVLVPFPIELAYAMMQVQQPGFIVPDSFPTDLL
ncbi:hypothetical protein VOLCADRAFT_119887 [Volvox carteri f. nagariensis]|uniref:Peptidase M50 domain-containing protein n=1 Tax=Volvox carteri f. nagariensis TaxID=3068 RepID=D8UHP0_VOLCA|nr:uncharacterized protein VOLCADRAFT_119887 [Volvox carteri f. nagariensis]EFJ40782.1 hypothetical protein VOLCADRAFT_119887 [Volvox carteri f. nagariensis]|eukprot:XP_002958157.1 hypothetical protein VOLCADRAFT_119887 [Volvox carteri f. nagariensis]